MDDGEDDPRFQPKHYSNYNASLRPRRTSRTQSYQVNTSYNEYNNDEFDDENQGLNQGYGDQEDDGEDEYQNGYFRGNVPEAESSRRPKKRRLENMVSSYEFTPRGNVNVQKEFYNVQDQPADWSEHATFVLLEVWGDRFLQLGRKSLRADDWAEVAEKVSEMCKMEITDTQCQYRLEALKKKYKKEKSKMEEMGMGGGYYGKWVFFKKMDMLLSSKKPYHGLPCGVDSGEYVFMNPRVYLNRSNALDEMRDSPGESESDGDDSVERKEDDVSFRLLADSVQKFGEIYEKIESSKRQQMMELEKMRMDFQRELELQKKQILDKAHAEIAKIREGGDEDDTDVSADDISG